MNFYLIKRTIGVLIVTVVFFLNTEGLGKVKVFILAGQSNMVGYGAAWSWDNVPRPEGTLDWLLEQSHHKEDFEHLVRGYDLDANDSIIKREDVWVAYKELGYGNFTIPNWAGARGGKCCIGPEAGIGWELGEFYQEQVLLIKTCWGGHSLAEKFLPPSSGGPGPSYTQMITEINEVLGDIKKHFPAYDGNGYEIVGFQWNQGWNDHVNEAFTQQYEANLVNFIQDVRKEFKEPYLPFVIAETGNSYKMGETRSAISLAQEAAADPAKHPGFEGNVKYVPTNQYADWNLAPYGGFYYHWAGSFYSYYKIGEAMGKAYD